MIKVYFATKLRGFFKHLEENENSKINFITNGNYYELSSNKKKLLLPIFRSKVFDCLGIIRQIKCENKECDYIGSFNRFIKCDRPYFIYLENPTALYEYCLGRSESYLGKKRLKKLLLDKNLKYIVCMSKACKNTVNSLLGEIPSHIEVTQIYPYIPENKRITEQTIKEKCRKTKISCLYIAQSGRFISKGGLEILEVFKRLELEKINSFELTIVTDYENLDAEIITEIKQLSSIRLLRFNLTYDELEQLYADTSILLHPTSDDSYGLTILEALKGGTAIISTQLYAIPEMVVSEENGYLIDPKYWFFNRDNIPNPKVWNDRKNTILSKNISNQMVDEIYTLIIKLDKDRELLEKMCTKSLHIAKSGKFSCDYINNQWNELLSR